MTRAEIEARRAALLPRLERLLVSLAHWRRHHKMRTNYTREDPRAGQSSVVPFSGNGAVH
jgi:hypothetical protein